MPDRKATGGQGNPKSAAKGGFGIACSEEGCDATAQITFDQGAAHKGGTLSEPGWAVLNSPEDNAIVFLCPTCFRESVEEEDVDSEEIDDLGDGP